MDYYNDHEQELLETGTCLDCGRDCNIIYEDEGIGAYEYWGFPGNDVQICASSDCCGAEVD